MGEATRTCVHGSGACHPPYVGALRRPPPTWTRRGACTCPARALAQYLVTCLLPLPGIEFHSQPLLGGSHGSMQTFDNEAKYITRDGDGPHPPNTHHQTHITKPNPVSAPGPPNSHVGSLLLPGQSQGP